jgi:hypothetical protein
MSLILSGTDGLSDIDGSAATPAIRGTDANTGIFFGADIIGFSEGGVEAMRIDASGQLGVGTASPAYKLDVAGVISTNNNLTFTGTGNRITGDFSNATFANRVAFQTSTANSNTLVGAIPNGTATTAGFWVFNNSDITNASRNRLSISSTDAALISDFNGTGTYLPMTFYTGGSESLRLSATTKAVILAGGSASANGTGIAFPATQSASSDVNTLDDYEEGTWTPNIGGTATYGTVIATYTKIGDTVRLYFDIAISVIGTGSTTTMSGIPFNCTYNDAGAISYFSTLNVNVYFIQAQMSGVTCSFPGTTAASATISNTMAIFKNGTRILGTVVYKTST